LQTVGKSLHHNEIFRRTKPENRIGLDFHQLGTPGCLLFKRQCAKRYIYSNAFRTFEKQNPVLKRKFSARFYPGLKRFQKWIDVSLFASTPREERKIYVSREPRFTPVLNGQPANKTKLPAALFACTLHLKRYATQFIHGALNLRKMRCCSTNPDV